MPNVRLNYQLPSIYEFDHRHSVFAASNESNDNAATSVAQFVRFDHISKKHHLRTIHGVMRTKADLRASAREGVV